MSLLTRDTAYNGARMFRMPRYLVSDEHCKTILECTNLHELAEEVLAGGAPFNQREVEILIAAASRAKDKDPREAVKGADVWSDEVLDLYAEHLYNYKYTYKPEATKIDSSIDPTEEHIGGMAQDFEKVNPATVKETPEGVKTVDVGRLALMDAPAIAALKRQVDDLHQQVQRLQEGQEKSITGDRTIPTMRQSKELSDGVDRSR